MTLQTAETTTAQVKSPFLSKTNITAAIMGLLGLFAAIGVVPEDAVSFETGGAIVTLGSGLVIAFRTLSKFVLRR